MTAWVASRTFALLGAGLALTAVALGAFGAHALKARVGPDVLAAFETGVRYQMYHAIALLACAWARDRWASPQIAWAGWLFVAGIVIFSGSLYLLTLSGHKWWGAITPAGGVAFLTGWGCFMWGLVSAK